MDYVLLIVQTLCASGMNMCAKEFSRTYMKNLACYFIFNFFSYIVLVAMMMIFFRPDFKDLSIYTIILAPCFAVFFTMSMLFLYRAMDRGLLSFTTLIFSFGVTVPMLFGILLWNETVSILQIIGLFLLFVTFYIGSMSSGADDTLGGDKKKFDIVWLLLCIGALFCSGGVMTVAKTHQMIMPEIQTKEFVVIAFGTISVLSLILFSFFRIKVKGSFTHMKNFRFASICLAQGVLTTFATYLGVMLAARIPAVIQFPTVNGGVVMLTSIFSVVIFKEKLHSKSIIGLAIGFTALALISGFIRIG